MTDTDLHKKQDQNTRKVVLPDGTRRELTLTPDLWEYKETIQALEGIPEADLSGHALEEMEHQGFSFDLAYRCVVAHLVNRWQ